MSKLMTREAILSDQSENMGASLEARTLGPDPEKQDSPPTNVVPFAALVSELESVGNGRGLR